MRVEMSFLVSFSCAWFAIMNLHVIRTQPTHSNGMCGRNTITTVVIPIPIVRYTGVMLYVYSATREDDTTFIFSHFGLFLSDAASNLHM